MEKRKRFIIISSIALAVIILFAGSGLLQQRQFEKIKSSCDTDKRQLSTVSLDVPAGDYDVMIQNTSGVGVQDVLVGYGRVDECIWFDRADVTSDWQKLDRLHVEDKERAVIQIGDSQAFEYGHINVLLLPDHLAMDCTDNSTCTYKQGSQYIHVTPDRSFSNDFALSASIMQSPADDSLVGVDVYDDEIYVKLGEVGQFSDQAGDGLQVGYYRSGQVATYQSNSTDESKVVRDGRRVIVPALVVGLVLLGFLVFVVVDSLTHQLDHRRFLRHRELYLDDDIWMSEKKIRTMGYVRLAASITIFMISSLVLLRLFVVDITTINGVSMEPNANNGQVRLVNKSPITLQNALKNETAITRGKGVYIDQKKLEPADSANHDLLYKRVVAIAGDKVTLGASGLRVETKNGENVSIDDKDSDDVVSIQMDYQPFELTIPEGTVFVLGDNRPNSIDSRKFGVVPVRYIVGVE